MIRICCVFYTILILLSGCASQSTNEQNFEPKKAAQTRVSLGLTYLKNGNYSQAKFNLDKALEFAPRSAEANFAIAYYYQTVGEIEQAEQAYQYSMDLDPKNANIANSYGAFLCQNGNYEKAKEYFLKAVNTDNYISSSETYENLALCSQSQGKLQDTITYLKSAVNHQPGRANSLFLLTQSLIEAKQWKEAKEYLRRYERVGRVSARSLKMASQIATGNGDYATAKGFGDMLLKMFPNDPEAIAVRKNRADALVAGKPAVKEVVHSPQIEKPVVISSTTAVEKVTQDTKTQALAETPTDEKAGTNQEVTINQEVATIQDADTSQEVAAYHVVEKGENLYRISLRYNIRMERLIEWNDLANASAIYQGKKLRLVAPDNE